MKNCKSQHLFFILVQFCMLLAGAVAAFALDTPAGPATDTVLEAPDLTTIEHIQGEYFSSCQAEAASQENWQQLEKDLLAVNTETFNVVKALAAHNKQIRKAIGTITKELEKVNTTILNRDIRRRKKKVLKSLDSLKERLAKTRESISGIKQRIDDSQQTVGKTYCRVDAYVTSYLARAEEAEGREWHDVAATDTSTAARMSFKRRELYAVMLDFDRYFGLLERLFNQANHKLDLLSSVQDNIVAFVDTRCRDRARPCTYEAAGDLRFEQVKLDTIMARIEEAFGRLVKTAQSRFAVSGRPATSAATSQGGEK